jgi:ribosomal protein S12 methylthiotransferase accessory factor
MSLKEQIDFLLYIINSLSLSATIQNSNAFYDELPVHFYSGLLRCGKKHPLRKLGFELFSGDIVAGGSSMDNPDLAVLKCAAELIERLCMYTFAPKAIIRGTYTSLSNRHTCVPPTEVNPHAKTTTEYGWSEGRELTTGTPILVPSQMVFLNYYSWARNTFGEKKIIQQISNGGCFGFDRESTMVRGVYELIERDSILTKFLARFRFPVVSEHTHMSTRIRHLRTLAHSYRFKQIVFDATGDLEIPTYFSAALDQSGIVPYATFGAKASLHAQDAIEGAIEESHMGRTWVRYELMQRNGKIPTVNPHTIRTRLQRAFYFADKNNTDTLLTHITGRPRISSRRQVSTDDNELTQLLARFKKKNMQVIAVDITPSFLKQYPIHVYKMVIPKLQYLYLEEPGKTIQFSRIADMCAYEKIEVPSALQTIPHFLL